MTACAYVDPSITDQTTVYSDSPVRKSPLQVSVHPKGKQYRPLTAYFHPFVIQQHNSDYRTLSNSFAQIFHSAWTEERLFPVQEFQTGTPYEGKQMALKRARRRGADLLVLGYVPYFFAGHTMDDTAITIQINIYAAGSGTLLWTMMQSGRIEDKLPDDYIYFRHEHRLPEGPFNKLIRAIAKDMAVPLKGWLPAPDTQFQFAETARDVEANLVPQPPMQDGMGDDDSMEAELEQDLPAESGESPADEDGKTRRPEVQGVNLDIRFETDRDTFKRKSYLLLDSLGEALTSEELKGKKIIIAGHTDSRGDEKYNLSLSRRRARQVKEYLVNKWGIDPALLQTVGYGKTRPLVDGNTPEAHAKNRRVEIRLAEEQ